MDAVVTPSVIPHVFVVDDDPAVLESTRYLLHCHGWSVRTFRTVGDCLGALQTGDGDPDCILCDLLMPALNGVDLLRRLGARGSHVPCVIWTGDLDSPMAVQARAAGACGVLEKPATFPQLEAAVLQAIRIRRTPPPKSILRTRAPPDGAAFIALGFAGLGAT